MFRYDVYVSPYKYVSLFLLQDLIERSKNNTVLYIKSKIAARLRHQKQRAEKTCNLKNGIILTSYNWHAVSWVLTLKIIAESTRSPSSPQSPYSIFKTQHAYGKGPYPVMSTLIPKHTKGKWLRKSWWIRALGYTTHAQWNHISHHIIHNLLKTDPPNGIPISFISFISKHVTKHFCFLF